MTVIDRERHRRWTDNYQYDCRLIRDSDGQFERIVEQQYKGRIYGRNEFIAGAKRAELLMNILNGDTDD